MTNEDMSTPASPFLFSYLLRPGGQGVALDAGAVSGWTQADGDLWVHFDIANREGRRWLQQESGLPPHAIEALLAEETRPRTLAMDAGLLIVLRGVNTNPGADPEDMVAVRIWIEPHRVISTRRRRLLSVVDIAKALDDGDGPQSASGLLTMLVDQLAHRIGDFVDSIEDRLDEIENDIGSAAAGAVRARLTPLRRQMAAVRRFLAPQRDALDRLYRQPASFIAEPDLHILREAADRITRYLEDLELARERAIVLQEELLSNMAQQQNTRMYVLSVIAAIFLPLTFVTGLLGMNVGGLPGVDSDLGFYSSVAIMVVAALGLFAFFRWKRWL
jgi:zinc transporter